MFNILDKLNSKLPKPKKGKKAALPVDATEPAVTAPPAVIKKPVEVITAPVRKSTVELEMEEAPIDNNRKKKPSLIGTIIMVVIGFLVLIFGMIVGGIITGGMTAMGITSLNINPFLLLLIVIFIIIIGMIVGGVLVLAIFKWKAPEAYFYLMLRMAKQVLVRIHYFNGREAHIRGTVTHKGILIEANGRPMCINPGVLGEGDNSYANGVEIIDVAANNLMAVGLVKTLGVFTVEEYYHDPRHHFDVLTRYEDSIVMFLYSVPDGELDEHCSLWVSVDPSAISWPEMVAANIVVDPQGAEESDDAFKIRYLTAYKDQFAPKTDEDQPAFKLRMKPLFENARYRRINNEVMRLKNEILRLKDETRGKVLTSRVFTYHAAMKAMDPRLSIEAYDRLEQIKEAEKPNQKPGTPDWVKGVAIIVAIGMMVLLICAGIYLVVKK